MKQNFAALIILFVFLSLISCAALWGTAYFHNVLSCGEFMATNCATAWAVIPLWVTGITIMIIPILAIIAIAQSHIDFEVKS